jgi:4a-hydroxytetrahydrobiopterin dehydratase
MQTYEILAAKECIPCKGDVPALKGSELKDLAAQLRHGWSVVEEHHLEKQFTFPDFRQALAFTNQIGAVAEAQGHHPDIMLGWGKVGVTIWTHKIEGLTESDFILAAKIESLPRGS